jgi:septal ring factor EnvC (AmiA/AmiB activator)
MSQPTWEDFHRLENEQKQLKEEVRKLKEQRTDEMKAINVNVASADVISRLDGIQQYFSQELKTVSDTWLSTLQEHYTEHKQDISGIQTVLKGHAKYFEEHGRRLGQIETSVNKFEATQQRQEQLLQEILDRLPPKQQRPGD